MGGIYLPFWVYDGFVEIRTSGREAGSQTAASWLELLGDERSPAGSLRDLTRATRLRASSTQEAPSGVRRRMLMFDNLIYPAVEFPPAWLVEQMYPFRLGAVVPYEPSLLGDWPAALYQRDVDLVARGAYSKMLAKAVWRTKSDLMAHATELDKLRRMYQVTTVSYQLVLLPVWTALARRERQQRLILVNGQTGKVVWGGELRPKHQA